MNRPFVVPSICQGGEELHELHVRYCVPLAEQLADTRTMTGAQLADVLDEAVGLFLEFRDQHAQDEDQARRSAVTEVLDGLFTDLPEEAPRRPCPKCDGCGRVGTDDEQTPWTFWENLPVKSAAAVVLGLVRPGHLPHVLRQWGGGGPVITREQLASLQPGDFIEMRSAENVEIRGRLMSYRGPGCDQWEGLTLGPGLVLRRSDGGVAQWWLDGGWELTVVSRPLYENHHRAEPVPGDVVRVECADHPDDAYTNVYLPRTEHDPIPWLSLTPDPGKRYSTEEALPLHLEGWSARLLIDGTTGQAVQ